MDCPTLVKVAILSPTNEENPLHIKHRFIVKAEFCECRKICMGAAISEVEQALEEFLLTTHICGADPSDPCTGRGEC